MKIRKNHGKSETPKASADETCLRCGSEMKETRSSLNFPVNGDEIDVLDSPPSAVLQM